MPKQKVKEGDSCVEDVREAGSYVRDGRNERATLENSRQLT